MKKAFTLIELMMVIAIIEIIAAIAIPNLIEAQAYHANTGKTIQYHDLVGKTFPWNGNKVIVTNYYNFKYNIVILNGQTNSIAVEADRTAIMEAYVEYVNKSIPAEKIGQ